ncbi:MAG: PKD domain-containing protein [Saprospiraceae bacterium]
MKRAFILLIASLGLIPPALAQHHDNTTLLGYYGGWITPPDDDLGISVLTFPDGSLHLEQNFELTMYFDFTNAPFSDSSGNLLCYSNGVNLMNARWDTIQNGETLTTDRPLASIWPQLALALPKPGHSNQVVLLYGDEEIMYPFGPQGEAWIVSHNLYAAEIDMAKNQGAGEVVSKGELVVQDTLGMGKFTACKHANGRDWWILAHEQDSKSFYRILLDPQGLHNLGAQKVSGIQMIDGLGQACFSPNGEHYLMYDGVTFDSTIGGFLNIYDFDRCTGLLSYHQQINLLPGSLGGVAFSPNSRYFYHNNWLEAYQYDMQAPNIAASKTLVAEWDGYHSPGGARFMFMQLMPDGKVYSSTSTITNVLHVIQYPDETAADCNYEQHAVHLPTRNSSSIPNFPNFRLGPLDGSSCDTLGLDNRPIAWYRYAQDTLDPLAVEFRDLSYYEPKAWEWDFGDGSAISTERHPQHQFDSAGVYAVCLTVSNSTASNTHCKTLYLGVTATDNPVLQSQIVVSPNPFGDRLGVALSANLRSTVFHLYDQMGRLVRAERLAFGITEINTEDLPVGMYFWEVSAAGEIVKSGKLVKTERQ